MDNQLIRKVSGIFVLLTTFAFCFAMFNVEVSAKKIERNLVPVNKSVSDNGITFTIGDAVKDGQERISLEYVIEAKQNISIQDMDGSLGSPEIFINGKRINHSNNWTEERIGENKYRGLLHINPVYELPNNYDVKVVLHQILNQSGQWMIEFSLK